jgi:prophage antirepressor-like protein/predicted GIY-YIG superfamily endonuclease
MTGDFYLDVYNKILNINNASIFILFDINGNIWFKYKDLLKALGYSDIKKQLKVLKIDKIYIEYISNIKVGETVTPTFNQQPKTKMINNNGLFMLLSISKMPLAKEFMHKYINDIMPSITKTGKYISSQIDMKNITKLNKRLNELQDNNKILYNNQRNVDYPIGNALYILKTKFNNKFYYKIGYTTNLNKRLAVYNTGNVNKILFNYYILVKDKLIDTCIKKIMKNEEYIKNKEQYKSSLTEIIKFIKKCDIKLNKMCCGYCLKCYNFINIKLHKCKYII